MTAYTRQDLSIMQAWPLERKIMVTQTKIVEWYHHYGGNVAVSFSGGKDSTVLLDLVRRAFPEVPAVFVDTGLELPNKKEYILTNEKMSIIASNINLSVTEINLRDEMGGERTLSILLEPLRSDYDYILIDTNPYLGLLTINALAACDSVLIPVSPQLWSATGLTDLLKTILKVKKKINPRIEIEGILLTMCDDRTNLYRDAKALIDEHYRDRVRIFTTEIPTTVRVGEANYQSRSVMELDPKNKAAIAYNAFAREVLNNG